MTANEELNYGPIKDNMTSCIIHRQTQEEINGDFF